MRVYVQHVTSTPARTGKTRHAVFLAFGLNQPREDLVVHTWNDLAADICERARRWQQPVEVTTTDTAWGPRITDLKILPPEEQIA